MKQVGLYMMLMAIAVTGCRDSIRDTDNDIRTSVEHNLAKSAYFDVTSGLHQFFSQQSDLLALGDTTMVYPICDASISLSTPNANFPVSFTVDFGDSTVCSDGYIRSGSFSGTVTKNYTTVFAKISASLGAYSLNNRLLEGSLAWQNKVVKGDTIIFDLDVDNGGIVADTTDMSWACDYRMHWYNGLEPTNTSSGFLVEGGASGRASKGNSFETEIVSDDYVWNLLCQWFDNGQEEVIPNNLAPRVNDYGELGDCDASYTITIASKSFTASLP